MHPANRAHSVRDNARELEFLRVPENRRGSVASYFNRQSSLILLEGPRGPMLAHYPFPTKPDTQMHSFYTSFNKNYKVFRGTKVPAVAPADVEAVTTPVLKSRDTRTGIVSSTVDSPGATASAPGLDDTNFMAGTGRGETALTAVGLRVSSETLQAHFGKGGLSVSSDGVHTQGTLHTRTPASKGVTKESPLRGLLPDTLATFPASAYTLDFESVQRIVTFVSKLRTVSRAIQSLMKSIRQL